MKKIFELLKQHAPETETVVKGVLAGALAVNAVFLYQNTQARRRLNRRIVEGNRFQMPVMTPGSMVLDPALFGNTASSSLPGFKK